MQELIRFSFLVLLFCSLHYAFPNHGFPNQNHPNLEFQLEDLHKSIRPDLFKSLQKSKQLDKIKHIFDFETISKMENDIKDFVSECKKRQKGHLLPTIHQFSKKITKKGGLEEFDVIDLMEWFMKSMIDVFSAMDHAMKKENRMNPEWSPPNEWPRLQDWKKFFVNLVKPMEKMVAHLYPLPPYQEMSTIMDGNKGSMRFIDEDFENWAGTLSGNSSVRTFFPRTISGIQEIIKMAKSQGARIRPSGIRHTTTPFIWGVDNDRQPQLGHTLEYVLAMVPQEVSDQLSYAREHEGWENDTDLVFMDGPLDVWEENGIKRASVRMGASSLNSHYFDWALKNNWTFPSNTIQHLMTIGGVATPMCHGAGIMHKTIADRILKIEYVDSEGELQYVDDPELLPAAAGSLGLLGVVTAITYKVDEMSYARFWPRNWEGGVEAFYNFDGEGIPDETIELMENSYYFEMIQFPVHHNVIGNLWLDAWDNKGRAEDAITPLLTDIEEEYQIAYLFLGEAANQVFRFLQKATGNHNYLYWTYGMLTAWDSSVGMLAIDEPITTTITEAMHWERGLHYISTNLFEVNIPIPPTAEGTPNWEIVKQSWKDMMNISAQFNAENKYPSDLGMESRLMAGSDLLLAPQHGNKWTQSIEVSGSPLVPREIWEEFKNALALKWSNYVDPLTGEKLIMRPHWAKEFPNKVGDDDYTTWAKKVFAPQIPEFMSLLKKVIQSNNGSFENSMKMFSTKYLDVLFEDYY